MRAHTYIGNIKVQKHLTFFDKTSIIKVIRNDLFLDKRKPKMDPKPTWYLLQTIHMRTLLTKIYKLYLRNNNALIQDGIKCNNDLIIVLTYLWWKKEISQTDIVKETMLSKQKVSKIVLELQSKKFVAYKSESSKTRNLKLYLTETGHKFAINFLTHVLRFDKSALRKIYYANQKIPDLIRDLQDFADSLTTVYDKKQKSPTRKGAK